MGRVEPERYKFNPDLHPVHYSSWLKCETEYLVNNYGKIPLTKISLSLGRTYRSVQRRVYELKNIGLIERKPKGEQNEHD